MTDLLLPIVALDDAVGLVVFSVSFGIAQAIAGGTLDIVSVIIDPLLEIVFSLILGAIMGTLLTVLEKLFFSNSNRLSLTISFVIMTIAMASREFELGGGVKIGFSPLLVCMMLGTVFCNFSQALGAQMGGLVRNIVLFSVLVYELAGPQMTRMALTSAGEIKAGASDAGNRARFEKKEKISGMRVKKA